MLYLLVFFVLFSTLFVLPGLLMVLWTEPVGPAQEQAAMESARSNARPLIAFLLAVAATVGGAHFKLLPGLRAPG